MNKKEYSQYLNHPLWQDKRNEVFRFFGKKCAKCGVTENLVIHHKLYEKGKLPWQYPLENFEVLCENCHLKEHSMQPSNNKCANCNATISDRFIYCFECYKSKIANLSDIEKQNKDNQIRIRELETKLSKELSKGDNSNAAAIESIKAELEKVKSEKNNSESQISQLNNQVGQLKNQNSLYASRIRKLESTIAEKYESGEPGNRSHIEHLKHELLQLKEEKMSLNDYLKEFDANRSRDALQTFKQIKYLSIIIVILILVAVGAVGGYLYINHNKNIAARIFPDDSENAENGAYISRAHSDTQQSPPAPNQTKHSSKGVTLTQNDIGKNVILVGKVLSIFSHPDGHKFLKFYILETDQQISIPIFSRLGYQDRNLKTNSIIKVTGKVSLYRDEIQVIPQQSSDIEILQEGSEIDILMPKISDIRKEMQGATVLLKTMVRSFHKTTGGTIIVSLEDSSNTYLRGVLFKTTAAALPGREILLKNASKDGNSVNIIGKVDIFQDKLQIVIEKVYR